MRMKTIAIKDELHEKLVSYGSKKETYNQIIERILNDAYEVQLSRLLLNKEGTTDVNDLEW